MMRFSVACHYWQGVQGWLADPHAYTIMASPPTRHGWRENWPKERNLALFAAPWELVDAYLKRRIDEAEYTRQFRGIMRPRVPQVQTHIHEMDGLHVTYLCSCPGHVIRDGVIVRQGFCHRYLVVKLLVWLGCSEEPWVATTKEGKRAA